LLSFILSEPSQLPLHY